MADQAGIINRGGPKDDGAFAQIAANAEPEIQELAYAVHSLDGALGRRSSAKLPDPARSAAHDRRPAADLQEEMAEQRFSVPSAPTKTAAIKRTSQRAKRAIKYSAMREQL